MPRQAGKMDRPNECRVRTVPTNLEEGNRNFACPDADNDLTWVAADHHGCAIKLSFLTDMNAKHFSQTLEQVLTVDLVLIDHEVVAGFRVCPTRRCGVTGR